MALNYIWIAFFLIAFAIGLIKVIGYYFREQLVHYGVVFTDADLNVFNDMMQSTFSAAKSSVEISIYLIGVMALWLGIMKIGELGGAVHHLSRLISPFLRKIFPEIPANHPAQGAMIMNFSANMLGLDNAATPLGLKAMKEMQELNTNKEVASNSQIMFIVLNTSGLTIIPVSVMALRMARGAANPSDIFLPILITTFFSSLAGLIAVSIIQKINLFNKTALLYLGGATAFILGLYFYISSLPVEEASQVSLMAANMIIFSVIIVFILMGIRRKINIYEAFISGAKEGFEVAIKIIPYLVAMLVAIGVFRASGALDYVIGFIAWGVELVGLPTDFIPSLPTAFMKPLSGSGARGMMVDAMDTYGVDSFVGKLASTLQGSTETTFYTLAVYFGAVNIMRTRYALACGLFADAVAIITAIFIAYLFFG
jgi:spore maturation protein SpmA